MTTAMTRATIAIVRVSIGATLLRFASRFARPSCGRAPGQEVLDDVVAGRRERYPLYGALLYTRERRLDELVWQYLVFDRARVDAMFGRTCMLFVVEDQSAARVDRVDLGFGTTDVYAVAERLGALPEDLPCVVFFASPDRPETLVVQMAYLLPAGPVDANRLQDAFTAVASAVKVAATAAADGRLRRLENELAARALSPGADVSVRRLRRAEATGRTVLAVLTSAADLYRKTGGLG
jgi:hypothetical protein